MEPTFTFIALALITFLAAFVNGALGLPLAMLFNNQARVKEEFRAGLGLIRGEPKHSLARA